MGLSAIGAAASNFLSRQNTESPSVSAAKPETSISQMADQEVTPEISDEKSETKDSIYFGGTGSAGGGASSTLDIEDNQSKKEKEQIQNEEKEEIKENETDITAAEDTKLTDKEKENKNTHQETVQTEKDKKVKYDGWELAKLMKTANELATSAKKTDDEIKKEANGFLKEASAAIKNSTISQELLDKLKTAKTKVQGTIKNLEDTINKLEQINSTISDTSHKKSNKKKLKVANLLAELEFRLKEARGLSGKIDLYQELIQPELSNKDS